MDVVARIATVGLGAMFVVAGVYKLIEGPAWPTQAADLGVGRPLALVVPWFELVLGAALVVDLAPPWTAIVAVGVLVVFTAVIFRRLVDGSRPPCACFGSRSTEPLGPRHLIRNLVLLVVAVIAVVTT